MEETNDVFREERDQIVKPNPNVAWFSMSQCWCRRQSYHGLSRLPDFVGYPAIGCEKS